MGLGKNITQNIFLEAVVKCPTCFVCAQCKIIEQEMNHTDRNVLGATKQIILQCLWLTYGKVNTLLEINMLIFHEH
jgi:hypothetical protein